MTSIGKAANKITPEQNEAIIVLHKQGRTAPEIKAVLNLRVVPRAVSRAIQNYKHRLNGALADAAEHSDALTAPMKKKIEALVRRRLHELNNAFEARVQRECQQRMDDILLPSHRKALAHAETVLRGRKGIMTGENYTKILACLHPDRVPEELKARYTEAFSIFTALRPVLCSDSPPPLPPLPRSFDEVVAQRAREKMERKAKRKAA